MQKKSVGVEVEGLLPLLRKSCQSSQHRVPEVETASGFLAPRARDCCCTRVVPVLTARGRSGSARLLLQAATALAPAAECVSSARRSDTGTVSAKEGAAAVV